MRILFIIIIIIAFAIDFIVLHSLFYDCCYWSFILLSISRSFNISHSPEPKNLRPDTKHQTIGTE